MNYFIDAEFLEGTQKKLFGETKPTIDLISIGIVCEDGREYYAISKDFNLKEAWNRYQIKPTYTSIVKARRIGFTNFNNILEKEYWLRDNVLKPIWKELIEKERQYYMEMYKRINVWTKYIDDDYYKFTYKEFKRLIKKYGKTNKQIAEEIKDFVNNPPGIYNQITLNENKFYGYYADYDWVVFCWLFGKMIDLPKGFPMYCIDLQQESDRIYNLEKEKYIKNGGRNFINKMSNHLDYPKQTNEHNSLSDARWNHELYKFLNKL